MQPNGGAIAVAKGMGVRGGANRRAGVEIPQHFVWYKMPSFNVKLFEQLKTVKKTTTSYFYELG